MTEYYIPTGHSQTELVEKRSRFIGQVWQVTSEEEARARIEETRKQHYDARHNCWCFRVREGGAERYSDDGEPQGTAGQPMLNVFQRQEVTNVCCVVTRYFGGVLLGTGGLVRAYTQAVKEGLKSCVLGRMRHGYEVRIETDYNGIGKILYILGNEGIEPSSSDYTDKVTLGLTLPGERLEALHKNLVEATGGKMIFEKIKELYYVDKERPQG